jgi:hypothetical protein
MSTATITQAQGKGLRHQFADIASDALEFCRKLYAAHGGFMAPVLPRGEKKMSSAQLAALADRFEAYAPNLADEIRFMASRG